MIMDVLRYFSTAQGTQAQTLAINIHHSSDKNHVKQVVVRERRVTEKQCCLVRNLSKNTILSKNKEVHLAFFHSENPWQSRQKKDIWRTQSFCWLVWHLFSKNYMTSYCIFDAGLSFWSLRATSAHWNGITYSSRIRIQAPQGAGAPPFYFSVAHPMWESGKISIKLPTSDVFKYLWQPRCYSLTQSPQIGWPFEWVYRGRDNTGFSKNHGDSLPCSSVQLSWRQASNVHFEAPP